MLIRLESENCHLLGNALTSARFVIKVAIDSFQNLLSDKGIKLCICVERQDVLYDADVSRVEILLRGLACGKSGESES